MKHDYAFVVSSYPFLCLLLFYFHFDFCSLLCPKVASIIYSGEFNYRLCGKICVTFVACSLHILSRNLEILEMLMMQDTIWMVVILMEVVLLWNLQKG